MPGLHRISAWPVKNRKQAAVAVDMLCCVLLAAAYRESVPWALSLRTRA